MKYQHITDYILGQIKNGSIKTSQKLPSIRDISEKFSCSKTTAIKAYEHLENQHVIYSVPQSGYYLVDGRIVSNALSQNELLDFTSASPHDEIIPYKDFEHCIKSAVDVYRDKLFQYTPVNGLPGLLKELVKLNMDYQIFVKPDNIFVVNGSQQAISLLANMPFPNGKQNILVEQPGYYGALMAFRHSGNILVGVRRKFDHIDMDELECAFKNSNIKFFYTVPRFQNPAGSSYTSEEKKHIAYLAKKYNVFIVEDDYMADMDPDTKNLPIYYYDDSSMVIYIKSFSKSLLPGLRVGSVVVPDILSETFYDYKQWSDFSTSVISQGALEIYLKNGMFSKHKSKLARYYSKKMDCVKRFACSLKSSNIKWNIPASGFFASLEIQNNACADVITGKLKNINMKFSNTRNFFINNYYDPKFMRFSISKLSDKDIYNGMLKLTEAIDSDNSNEFILREFNI